MLNTSLDSFYDHLIETVENEWKRRWRRDKIPKEKERIQTGSKKSALILNHYSFIECPSLLFHLVSTYFHPFLWSVIMFFLFPSFFLPNSVFLIWEGGKKDGKCVCLSVNNRTSFVSGKNLQIILFAFCARTSSYSENVWQSSKILKHFWTKLEERMNWNIDLNRNNGMKMEGSC